MRCGDGGGLAQGPQGRLAGAVPQGPAHLGRETWVFVDTGKAMPDHLPLLKERYHLRRADARVLWEGLMAQGWLKTRPAWGVYAEP